MVSRLVYYLVWIANTDDESGSDLRFMNAWDVLGRLDASEINLENPDLHSTDHDFPVAWVKTHGRGNVFCSTFGHPVEVWDHPDIQTMYLEALKWSMGLTAYKPRRIRSVPESPWSQAALVGPCTASFSCLSAIHRSQRRYSPAPPALLRGITGFSYGAERLTDRGVWRFAPRPFSAVQDAHAEKSFLQ